MPPVRAGNSSHLLALGGDVARSFDDLLSPVVVLVEFATEGFEYGHERGSHRGQRVRVGRGIVRFMGTV